MFKKAFQQGRSEAHGATSKERHAWRAGETAVSQARRTLCRTLSL